MVEIEVEKFRSVVSVVIIIIIASLRWGVGQNLFISKQTVRLPETDWSRAITDWYEEVKLFSKEKVKPFKFSAEYGHYTAMVWATTDKVGCGATSYRDGQWYATLYTCNYGPNGNFIRGAMYKQVRPRLRGM